MTVRRPFALAGGVLHPPSQASADSLNAKFSLSVGGFLLTTNTTVRLDGTEERGTPVNLEHELGFTNESGFQLDGYWRFCNLRWKYGGLRLYARFSY